MRFIATLLSLVAVAVTAQAATKVYKTVDETGAVSFSDTPPADDGQYTEILHIETPEPADAEAYQERLDAIRESTDRMAEDRRAREKHRAELRESRARVKAMEPQTFPYPAAGDQYPVSYSYPYRWHQWRPWKPDHGLRPEHPIYHPPLLPGVDHIGSRNSQLMRPLVSPPQ